jgi:hypothetical protein
MNKELLRMQMLTGIITESQYKQLSDMIEDADFMKIDKLYTALYTELRKHE